MKRKVEVYCSIKGTTGMSSILYNTNSRLLSRYHRKAKLSTQLKHDENEDEPYTSPYDKDSKDYLVSLCCSAYPQVIHRNIQELSPTKLSIHAFFALIFKNFVTSWYGTKIPTADAQFMAELFSLIERLLNYLNTKHDTDFASLICDDWAMLLSQHIRIMRKVVSQDLGYAEFNKLCLYDNRYPRVIVSKITGPLDNGSELQRTFLEALIGDLLLSKVLERIVEPFILMEIIASICNKLLLEVEEKPVSALDRIRKWAWSFSHGIAYMTSMNNTTEPAPGRPFVYKYIFTLFKHAFQLESRKPLFYSGTKFIQKYAARSSTLNHILGNMFNNLLKTKFLNPQTISIMFIQLRHVLFPNDNKMGPGKVPPTEEEFELLKKQCEESISRVCIKHRLYQLLGITDDDISAFVKAICWDKYMNRFILHRLLDCVIAHIS